MANKALGLPIIAIVGVQNGWQWVERRSLEQIAQRLSVKWPVAEHTVDLGFAYLAHGCRNHP